MEEPRFRDRRDAGEQLARKLLDGLGDGAREVLVLALPRGGVPVAVPVADALGAPLDVLVVRKLGTPGHEELAMGAIASGGAMVMNPDVAGAVDEGRRADVLERERRELERRERVLRGDRSPLSPQARTVVVVDDGLATGATMRVAVATLRDRGASRVVVAVPVGPATTCELLAQEADDVLCLHCPEPFRAVGLSYADFDAPRDEELREVLARR